jgi:Holliday junction resolvase-like predicted endonuclease
MTNYTNGRAMEYLARNTLTADGYTVLRAAGSKGPVDLIAWNNGGARFIQVKKGRGAIRPAERAKLRALPIPPASTVELWTRVSGQWEVECLVNTHEQVSI